MDSRDALAMLRNRSQIVVGIAMRMRLDSDDAKVDANARLIERTIHRMWEDYDDALTEEERAKDQSAHLGVVGSE